MDTDKYMGMNLNIKLTTPDGLGSAFVLPDEMHTEDDGTITLTVKAWKHSMLTFHTFAGRNLSRALRWHPGGLEQWSLSDWSVALAGEVGELCNVVKKLNRVRDNLQQNAVDTSKLKSMLADEIGDVGAYLDLCAQAAGLSLEECIRNKFNKISERENFPEKL